MSRNIITLVFLSLMLMMGIFAMRSYNQLQKEKKENQALLLQVEETLKTNKELKQKADEITRKLMLLQDSVTPRNDSRLTAEKTTLIRELKLVNETYTKENNLSAYQQAYVLEKDGFIALTQNKFELALEKISLAEKTSSGFHMCFEIAELLRKNQKDFGEPAVQQNIKRQIIEKYSWKAPADQLNTLKNQVR